MTHIEANYLFHYADGVLYWRNPQAPRLKTGDKAGSVNSRGYLCTKVKDKSYRNHKLIFLMHYGYMPEIVDHINGDKTDNHIENLRAADKAKNAYNSKTPSTNKSGVKGVSWRKEDCKWRACIQANGKRVHLGSFEKLDDAANAVRKAREELHQEFANHG